eukprot:3394486-Rhodomonas_salina.1
MAHIAKPRRHRSFFYHCVGEIHDISKLFLFSLVSFLALYAMLRLQVGRLAGASQPSITDLELSCIALAIVEAFIAVMPRMLIRLPGLAQQITINDLNDMTFFTCFRFRREHVRELL